MDLLKSCIQTVFPQFPTSQKIFEAIVIRDFRVLMALIVSFVVSGVLIVLDVRSWWSYETKRRQIILLPAEQTRHAEKASGVQPTPVKNLKEDSKK